MDVQRLVAAPRSCACKRGNERHSAKKNEETQALRCNRPRSSSRPAKPPTLLRSHSASFMPKLTGDVKQTNNLFFINFFLQFL
jgi:hypothetical protein